MKKSILRMTGFAAVAALFCVLYVTCNDNGAGNGRQDDRVDAFVSKFNGKSAGDGNGNDNGNGGGSCKDWNEWVDTKPATCDAAGVKTRTCKTNNSQKETGTIPMLTGASCDPGHTHEWGEWDTTISATCTTEGLKTRTCILNTSHKETGAIAKLTGAACESGGSNTCGLDGTANSCKTATINNQTWMAENLNYESKTGGSWCYVDLQTNCTKYGRLYTWDAAKTACPSGWHLPDTLDWNGLVTKAGSYSTAGGKLKSTSGWNSYSGVGSTNEFGFSALPGGYRYGGYFEGVGTDGYWWTADLALIDSDCSDCASSRGLAYNRDVVSRGASSKSIGYSVRCIKDN